MIYLVFPEPLPEEKLRDVLSRFCRFLYSRKGYSVEKLAEMLVVNDGIPENVVYSDGDLCLISLEAPVAVRSQWRNTFPHGSAFLLPFRGVEELMPGHSFNRWADERELAILLGDYPGSQRNVTGVFTDG